MKQTYETPMVEKLGSFEELTQSTNTGGQVDANFDGLNIQDSLS